MGEAQAPTSFKLGAGGGSQGIPLHPHLHHLGPHPRAASLLDILASVGLPLVASSRPPGVRGRTPTHPSGRSKWLDPSQPEGRSLWSPLTHGGPQAGSTDSGQGRNKHPITCCQKHHAWAPLHTWRTQLRADPRRLGIVHPRTPDPTPHSLGPCLSEPSWVPTEDLRGRGWRWCPQLPPKPPLACRCDQGNHRTLSTHGPGSPRERSEDQKPAERHSPEGYRRGGAGRGPGLGSPF